MAGTAIATLKADWHDTDPYEWESYVLDTLVNPQDAVVFTNTVTLASSITLRDSQGLYLGTGSDASIVHDGVTGVDVSVADDDSGALRVIQGSNEYLVFNTGNDVERVEVAQPLDAELGFDRSAFFEVFDDFLYQAITENDNPWVLNAGTCVSAIDPAINAQENGVIRLTTGTLDATEASNGSQLTGHIPMQADSGGLFFETRLRINTTRAAMKLNAGFTDVTTLELPYECVGTAYAPNATDAVVFMMDYQAGAQGSWHAVTVDTNVEDHGNTATTSYPTAGTYQVLRIEVDSTGGTCKFFVDGALVGTTSHAGVTPTVSLYPTVIASGGSAGARTVDVDYVHAGHTRSQP